MEPPALLYSLVLYFIKSYKWVELQVLTLFQNKVERLFQTEMEKLGIIFHPKDKPLQELTKEKEEEILSKCKYDHLVHLKASKCLFVQVANQPSIGMGKGFMDGHLDFTKSEDDIIEFVYRAMDSNLLCLYFNPWNRFLQWLEFNAFNLQTPKRVWDIARQHYDFGNQFFEIFMDPWMQYSIGYWANADNLNDALLHKLGLIARKLDLKPGMRVLEIGCGWGGLCKYLATNYGVSCVGITISKEGLAYGKQMCEGLDVEFRLQDYREITGEFDRIVSIEMIEHVGPWNHRKYFEVVRRCLKEDGIFLLESVGINHNNVPNADPFVHTYLIPNVNFPYVQDITKAIDGLFIIEDWHTMGPDCTRSAVNGIDVLIRNQQKIESKYGGKLYRMYVWWFAGAVGAFKARRYQAWQIVLSKNGLRNGYRAAR